ncbi:MAG: T9SS type A sorting domain-containing protein [Paludibacter sp.]|nr:T9SS type A sorting domain-containing protein [Paludibacter sp.]
MESYMKGAEDDFDIIKEQQYNPATYLTAKPTAGNFLAWKDFVDQVQTNNIANNANYQKIQGKNADGTINSSFSNLLDVENYIDYMLINYYIGNLDWNKNNWTAARNRKLNETGFRFFCWDAENCMTTIGINIITTEATSTNPAIFIQYLIKNSDFKILLADRIQKHLLNAAGTLTPAAAVARYIKLADEIDMPIIAESARWGDCIGTLYAKNSHWTPRKQRLLTNYFPFRTDTVIKQLRNAGYFPTVQAPTFTHYGGTITSAINLGMSTNSGTIYYTTDGSDPRTSITGTVTASSKTYTNTFSVGSSFTVKARAKTSTEWSPITEAAFVYAGPSAVEIPLTEQLAFGNYPNPFSESTRVHLTLPYDSELQIDIYSIDGRLVKQLFKGKGLSGYNQFDWTPANTESGVYICRIQFQSQNYYLKLMKK